MTEKKFEIKKEFDALEPIPDITETQKRALKEIESLDMNSHRKMELIATALGMKGGSLLDINAGGEDVLENILHALELKFRRIKEGGRTGSYVVARDEAVMTELLELFSRKGLDSNAHQRIGELLGYPKSAVDAYIDTLHGGESAQLSEAERWRDFGLHDGEFLFFNPSREHWKEEKRWLDRIVRTLKEYTPDLYEKILKH